jgi:hypothetical protein
MNLLCKVGEEILRITALEKLPRVRFWGPRSICCRWLIECSSGTHPLFARMTLGASLLSALRGAPPLS